MSATKPTVRPGGSDTERFERIYQRHFSRVAAYLLARTDQDSAADALSRTFEIAWRRLPDVPAEPVGWLLEVARRVLAEQRRARSRRDALTIRINESAVVESEDHLGTMVARETVLAAIADLTPFQQEALLLIAWDGLSEREAAAMLGCSRGAFALRMHRARKQLYTALNRTEHNTSVLHDASPLQSQATPVDSSGKEPHEPQRC
jgi:RNA polymerase sigma factor (sigma-70 family)